MDRRLIGNWNSRVPDKNDIYILRDMFHRTKEGGGKCLKILFKDKTGESKKEIIA